MSCVAGSAKRDDPGLASTLKRGKQRDHPARRGPATGTGSGKGTVDQGAILAMLKRRPCTAEDVAAAFSLDINETQVILRKMVAGKMIRKEIRNGDEYFIGRE